MVFVCFCLEGYFLVIMGFGLVIYVDNMVCRLVCLLVMQVDCFIVCSYQILLILFVLMVGVLFVLDEEFVLVLIYLELFLEWIVLGSFLFEVFFYREFFLYLVMRWGLVKFFQFFLCFLGGFQVLVLFNEDGVILLDLVLCGGYFKLVEDVINFQGRWLLSFF